jgi:hypothetical protein
VKSAEVIAAMVDHSMAGAEDQVRRMMAERGASISDDQLARLLEPLRQHLIVEYTDSVEAARGL